ncbi:MAG: DUF5666 domain-containing protein [Acidobacteriaceae bacterium]
MKFAFSSISPRQASCLCRLQWVFGIFFAAASIAGCGGGAAPSPGPNPTGNTSVTVLATSTANDQLFNYHVTMMGLTLTSQSGNKVKLLPTPLYPEFIHLNGIAEPLNTVSIPQDIYTSATATLGPLGFVCAIRGANGSIQVNTFAIDTTVLPVNYVTVNLPAPITISGASMNLALDLLVSQSASLANNSCALTSNGSFSASAAPTFTLTTATSTVQSSNPSNGKLVGMEGLIATVNSAQNSFSVNAADGSNYGGGTEPPAFMDPANGPIWQVVTDSNTVFQGISGISQLADNMAVDMDGIPQPDGSLLATRIAVYDTNTTNTSLWVVPVLFVNNTPQPLNYPQPTLSVGDQEELGPVLGGAGSPVNFTVSTFHISGQMTNLANLPFPASFTGSNVVPGQRIGLTAHAPAPCCGAPGGNNGVPATSITLLPQTINGTVSAVSSSGSFDTYTVTLAPYDLFPTLAVQQRQNTLLTNPSQVVVYVDNNTQMLNTNPVAVGSLLRFYGLVFNDKGTLRMDCAQINDGVPE